MTDDELTEWRQALERKADEQRRFRELEVAAATSQIDARRRKPAAAKKAAVARAAKPAVTRRHPETCTGGCGAMVRPAHTTLEDWPGTVLPARGSLCKTCGEGGRKRNKVPDNCVGCGRALYKPSTPRDQRTPGASQHVGRGYGACCYWKASKR